MRHGQLDIGAAPLAPGHASLARAHQPPHSCGKSPQQACRHVRPAAHRHSLSFVLLWTSGGRQTQHMKASSTARLVVPTSPYESYPSRQCPCTPSTRRRHVAAQQQQQQPRSTLQSQHVCPLCQLALASAIRPGHRRHASCPAWHNHPRPGSLRAAWVAHSWRGTSDSAWGPRTIWCRTTAACCL
jgi:hypothetical protein